MKARVLTDDEITQLVHEWTPGVSATAFAIFMKMALGILHSRHAVILVADSRQDYIDLVDVFSIEGITGVTRRDGWRGPANL